MTDCQRACESVYEAGNELTEKQEQELEDLVQRAMLYKVGKIDHSLCNCCCVSKFQGKGLYYGQKMYNRQKWLIMGVIILNLALQLTLTTLDQRYENTLYANMPV